MPAQPATDVGGVHLRALRRLLLLLLAGVAGLIGLGGTAHAESADAPEFTRYDVQVSIDGAGVVDVAIDFDVDFGDAPSPGPSLAFPQRQVIDGDRGHQRVLSYAVVDAESTSGAPDGVTATSDGEMFELYLGDPDTEIDGEQSYRVTLRITGLADSRAGPAGEDEFAWQAIGAVSGRSAISDIRIEVEAAGDVVEAGCVVAEDPCESSTTAGRTAVFSQSELPPGQAMSVTARYPAGTFGGVVAEREPRRTVVGALGLSSIAAPIAAGLAVIGSLAVALLVRRRVRAEQVMVAAPGAAQSEPPRDVRPGELGTIADGVVDPHDVTATIVDLAVRGFVTIVESRDDDAQRQWALRRPEQAPGFDDPGLADYERDVLRAIFHGSSTEVNLAAIAGEFAAARHQLQHDLYREVTERGWFRNSPRRVSSTWALTGGAIVVLGMLAGLVLGWTVQAGIVGAGVVVIGVAVMIGSAHAPVRTASGTALLVRVLRFGEFLRTGSGAGSDSGLDSGSADDVDLDVHADAEVFSRNLPYAIAFDATEDWARVFAAAVEAADVAVAAPAWYSGPAVAGEPWVVELGESMSRFVADCDAVVMAP